MTCDLVFFGSRPHLGQLLVSPVVILIRFCQVCFCNQESGLGVDFGEKET